MSKRLRALGILLFVAMRVSIALAVGAVLSAALHLARRTAQYNRPTAGSSYQTTQSQQGEVTYRQRAAFGQPEAVYKLVETRMERRQIFRSLLERGVTLSPFIELGAERGQTSLLLSSEFAAVGAATDLSLHSLQVIPILREHFGYASEPLAVCCDATHLPVRDGALPFVFCFATLHHFDNMRPVLSEVRRVLGKGGHFFFAEEPLKSALCLNLYRCPRADKMNRFDHLLYRFGLLPYIAEAFLGSKEETEYGIVENQSVTLQQWQEALSIFDRHDLDLQTLATPDGHAVRSALMHLGTPEPTAQQRAASLFGCVVSGLCTVEQGPDPLAPEQFMQAFICPDCHGPLQLGEVFSCPSCGDFARQGNVHILLPRDIRTRLYGPAL